MCFFEKLTALVMLALIFNLSDVHLDSGGVTHTNLANDEKTTVNEFLIPQRFPENETSVVFNDEKIRVVPYHNGTFSPNILKTLEFTVVQMTVEKYNTGKSVKNYRCRYEEIIRNTSDPIMKIMNGLNAKSAINCNDKLLIIPLESHGDHGNPTQSAKNPTTSDKPSDNRLPNELPKDQTTIFINGEPVPIIPYNNSMCWPNISRTFWHSMIYTQGEKSAFGKNFKRLRCRYDELTKNVTDHIMQIIYAVNELSNLLQSNVDSAKNGTTCDFKFENSLKNGATCDSRVEDSYAKSVTVPFLLIVILLLVTYIGFLYRKFQFTYYKDTQILVEDELVDP